MASPMIRKDNQWYIEHTIDSADGWHPAEKAKTAGKFMDSDINVGIDVQKGKMGDPYMTETMITGYEYDSDPDGIVIPREQIPSGEGLNYRDISLPIYRMNGTTTLRSIIDTPGWIDSSETKRKEIELTRIPFESPRLSIKLGSFSNTALPDETYRDISDTAPVLIEDGYLYINKGYNDYSKISLAKLVPDGSTVGTDTNSALIYKTVSTYNNDGKLITGTMDDSVISTEEVASATELGFGTSLNISKGYLATDLHYKAPTSGDLGTTTLSHALVSDASKVSGYSYYRATATKGYNATNLTADITVYNGEWS